MGSLILSTLALAGVATAGTLTVLPLHSESRADGMVSTSAMPIHFTGSVVRRPVVTLTEVISTQVITHYSTHYGTAARSMPAASVPPLAATRSQPTMTSVTVPVTSSMAEHTSETTGLQHETEAITNTTTIMQSDSPKHKHHNATGIIIAPAPVLTLETVSIRHASRSARTLHLANNSSVSITQQSTMTTMATHTLPSSNSTSSISAVSDSATPGPNACHNSAMRVVLKEAVSSLEAMVTSMANGDNKLGHKILDDMKSFHGAAKEVCPVVQSSVKGDDGGDGDEGDDGDDDHDAVLQRAKVSISTMKEEVSVCDKAWDVMCDVVRVSQDLEKAFQKKE